MINARTRRWWAVGALALALLMAGLDVTVLSLALPILATDLHASTTQLQWIVDAYTLVLAAALLPGGLLGDRLGRKRVLLASLLLFGAASLACAYAPSASALIAARAVSGLGAAFILPLSLSMMPVLFTEEERRRAVIVLMATTVVAYPIGPILGGWLLTHFWWGSVFLINVPVAILAFIAVAALLPESRSAERPRLDVPGVAISSIGLAGLTYGVIETGEKGWGEASTVSAMILGALVLVAFVFWERHISRAQGGQPLVDLTLFRSPGFTWGTLLATMVSFAMFGLLFTVPQYFQEVEGVDAMGAGIRLLPMIAGLVVGAGASDRLARLTGAKAVIALGFALMATGLLLGSKTTAASGDGLAATWIAIMGAGLGFALPAAMNAALDALTAERSGVGSALILALRTTGGAIGVAVLGTVLNSTYHSRLDLTGVSPAAADAARQSVSAGVAVARQIGSTALLDSVRAAFVHGMDVMLVLCASLAIVSAALTLAFLPSRAPATTQGEEARLEDEYASNN